MLKFDAWLPHQYYETEEKENFYLFTDLPQRPRLTDLVSAACYDICDIYSCSAENIPCRRFQKLVDMADVMSELTVRRRTHRGNNERWRLSLNHESI